MMGGGPFLNFIFEFLFVSNHFINVKGREIRCEEILNLIMRVLSVNPQNLKVGLKTECSPKGTVSLISSDPPYKDMPDSQRYPYHSEISMFIIDKLFFFKI